MTVADAKELQDRAGRQEMAQLGEYDECSPPWLFSASSLMNECVKSVSVQLQRRVRTAEWATDEQ